MNQNKLVFINDAAAKIGVHFNDESLSNINDYDALHEKITALLVGLLINEMEKLFQMLYRIDVDERKIKMAFALNQPQLIAPEMATLIIERELQKAESRARFR